MPRTDTRWVATPLRRVSINTYCDEKSYTLPPDVLCVGENYIARLVLSSFSVNHFAADYLVKVMGMREPRRGFPLEHVSPPFRRVSLAAVDPDSDDTLGSTGHHPMTLDGTFYTARPLRLPILEILNSEDGYIKSALTEDDFTTSLLLNGHSDSGSPLTPIPA